MDTGRTTSPSARFRNARVGPDSADLASPTATPIRNGSPDYSAAIQGDTSTGEAVHIVRREEVAGVERRVFGTDDIPSQHHGFQHRWSCGDATATVA